LPNVKRLHSAKPQFRLRRLRRQKPSLAMKLQRPRKVHRQFPWSIPLPPKQDCRQFTNLLSSYSRFNEKTNEKERSYKRLTSKWSRNNAKK
jgi:hypothetical protein